MLENTQNLSERVSRVILKDVSDGRTKGKEYCVALFLSKKKCDTCDNWYHQVCALTPLDDDIFWHCTFCVAINTM